MKKLLFVLVAIISAFTFTSCQDIIYANIRREVALRSGSFEGSVRNIIRFKEHIYVSNGATIYRKEATEKSFGHWQNMGANGLGGYIMNLAADGSNLYALVGKWEENLDKGQNRWNNRVIYCSTDATTWTPVTNASYPVSPTGYSGEGTVLYMFCTNSTSGGTAYINHDGNGYKLNGTSAPSAASDANGAAAVAKGYFAKPTNTSYGAAACEGNGSVYYYSSGATLYSSAGNSVGTGGYILSLAATKNTIWVGTWNGIERYGLDDSGKITGKLGFSNNADAIMTSAYEVTSLLVIDPSKPESETSIYAATDFEGRNQQFDHICVWACHNGGEWNRE